MRRHDRRGSWYLLTGMVLGVAFGLFYSWMVSPVIYVNAPPYALRVDFKDEYRVLVASAYLYSEDLVRAEKRLAELRDSNIAQTLSLQAQEAFSEGRPEAEVKALGLLALAFGQGVTPPAIQVEPPQGSPESTTTNAQPSTPVFSEPTGTPSPLSQTIPLESTPEVTPIPNPLTPTSLAPLPTATQGAAFILSETSLVCNPDQPQPLIQVLVSDAAGQPVFGVELVVSWDDEEDHFFTGLQPEISLGYADFLMTPGVVYALQVAAGGQPATGISAAECLAEEDRYWGSWLFTYTQP